MCEDIHINESEYIIDWRTGHILIIDLDKSQYIRFWVEDAASSIKPLLTELLFAEVIKRALNGDYGNWKSLIKGENN